MIRAGRILNVRGQTLGSKNGGSVVRNPPAKQETRLRSLGQENPFEKEMTNHSSILAWKIPQTEEPVYSHGL